MRLHEKISESTTSFEFFCPTNHDISCGVVLFFALESEDVHNIFIKYWEQIIAERKRKWQSQTAFQCARVAQDPHRIPNPFDDAEVARFVPTAKESVKSWTRNCATTRVFVGRVATNT